MDKILKKVLLKLEEANFEAYITGGYVRDRKLNSNSYDIDIATNALPKDIHKLFNQAKQNKFGGFTLFIKKYSIDFTTYRIEKDYVNRKPTVIEYINSSKEDSYRRDFTVNALYMDKNDKIIDYHKGLEDIKKRTLVCITDPFVKLTQDPLRILRAIRFATILNFELENSLRQAIIDNRILLKNLSVERVKKEFSKILISKNCIKGLNLIKELKIDEILNINCDDVKYSEDLLLMYAQLGFSEKYFSKIENKTIKNINIIMDYGTIDDVVIYEYGFYLSMIVGDYLNISKKEVSKMYKKMWISDEKPLVLSTKEIMDILDIEEGKLLGSIKNELCDLVLSKEVKNDKKALKKYLINRKGSLIEQE